MIEDVVNRLDAIIRLHCKTVGQGGVTTGYCSACDYVWPCPTVHLANGWGDFDDCFDEGWCDHVGMRLK